MKRKRLKNRVRNTAAAAAVVAACCAFLAGPLHAKPTKFSLVAKGGKGKKAWKIYRGDRIKNYRDLLWLKRRGVTRVVALENFRHREVARNAKRLGLVYLPRWMAFGGPREKGRRHFGNKVTAHLVKPGHVTYLYCTFGVHRTGGTVARFRAEQGWTCDRTLKEAKRHGFRKNKYAKYHHLIKWVMSRCRANKPAKRRKKKGRAGP